MNGVLLYKKEDAERNRWFIQKLICELSLRGVSATLALAEDDLARLPDFAIVRSIMPERNAELEHRGVRVFNNAATARVACDKWESYLLCKRLGLAHLQTALSDKELAFPLVVKARRGHGGTEVFWSENASESAQYGKEYLFQAPCDTLGIDTRVYAVGGKVVAAVKRTAKSGFKSNFSLGGSVALCSVTKEQKEAVERLYEALRFDYLGVDFLPHNGGWVVNELEDAAGARMLYSVSDIDIASIYAEHISRELKK